MFKLEYREVPTVENIFERFNEGRYRVVLRYCVNMYNFNDYSELISLLGYSSFHKGSYILDIKITSKDLIDQNQKFVPKYIDISLCRPNDIVDLVNELKTTFEILL